MRPAQCDGAGEVEVLGDDHHGVQAEVVVDAAAAGIGVHTQRVVDDDVGRDTA
jgi:hypothetical protein